MKIETPVLVCLLALTLFAGCVEEKTVEEDFCAKCFEEGHSYRYECTIEEDHSPYNFYAFEGYPHPYHAECEYNSPCRNGDTLCAFANYTQWHFVGKNESDLIAKIEATENDTGIEFVILPPTLTLRAFEEAENESGTSLASATWYVVTPEPELIKVTLRAGEAVPAETAGCPLRLINTQGNLLYSNIAAKLGRGVIYEDTRNDRYMGCVRYDPENETIRNYCAVTLTAEYCFMQDG